MDNLQTMPLDNYLYIGQYYHAYELIRDKLADEQQEIRIRLHIDLQHDQQTYNLPTTEEIAVIIPEEGVYHAIDNRDVVLWTRGEQLEWISQNSPLYTALYYVLLFSKGKNGWHPRIPICGTQLREQGENRRQRNRLVHRWSLIHATIPIVFMSEMVLSYLSSIAESYFSSLLLMYGQIINRGNSIGLGHINILLDQSSTRDYRMLLYMIDIMEKILGLWDTNLFFLLLM